jgi:hypothetical protein
MFVVFYISCHHHHHQLIIGYDYDDFDKICGLARGHTGWGNPHCFLPPCLSDTHSVPARHRSQVDPYFDLYRYTCVYLFVYIHVIIYIYIYIYVYKYNVCIIK